MRLLGECLHCPRDSWWDLWNDSLLLGVNNWLNFIINQILNFNNNFVRRFLNTCLNSFRSLIVNDNNFLFNSTSSLILGSSCILYFDSWLLDSHSRLYGSINLDVCWRQCRLSLRFYDGFLSDSLNLDWFRHLLRSDIRNQNFTVVGIIDKIYLESTWSFAIVEPIEWIITLNSDQGNARGEFLSNSLSNNFINFLNRTEISPFLVNWCWVNKHFGAENLKLSIIIFVDDDGVFNWLAI